MSGRFSRWQGTDRRRDALRRFWMRDAMRELAHDAHEEGDAEPTEREPDRGADAEERASEGTA